jgi:hypothetical protein
MHRSVVTARSGDRRSRGSNPRLERGIRPRQTADRAAGLEDDSDRSLLGRLHPVPATPVRASDGIDGVGRRAQLPQLHQRRGAGERRRRPCRVLQTHGHYLHGDRCYQRLALPRGTDPPIPQDALIVHRSSTSGLTTGMHGWQDSKGFLKTFEISRVVAQAVSHGALEPADAFTVARWEAFMEGVTSLVCVTPNSSIKGFHAILLVAGSAVGKVGVRSSLPPVTPSRV